MPPFASANHSYAPRYVLANDLTYLTENMSLHSNNASPPSSNSSHQSPEQHSHPSPTPIHNRADRVTAHSDIMANRAGKQNGVQNAVNSAAKNTQPYTMNGRYNNSISNPPQIANPWAQKSASNMINSSLQATDNNFLSTNTFSNPLSTIPNTNAALAQALAIQQAMVQPGMQNDVGPVQFDPLDIPQTIITERSLQNATSYAFYRGNGQYTRLVPLDELPTIAGVPTVIPNSNGLIILQIPRQHQAITMPAWAVMQQAPLTPGSFGSTPSSGSSGSSMGSRHYDAFTAIGLGQNQGFTPNNYANRVLSGPGRGFGSNATPGRRDKVYCDKWVHDGVCAFAQQGCKYKHEMPLDVTTQRSLGLFHGLPSWWKREHGLEMKRVDDGEKKFEERRGSEVEKARDMIRESLGRAPTASADRGLGGGLTSWRLSGEKRSSAANTNSALSQNAPRGGSLFGNIGSRSTSSSTSTIKGPAQPTPLHNAYSILDVEDITSPGSSTLSTERINSNGGRGSSMTSNGINTNSGIATSMYAGSLSPNHNSDRTVKNESNVHDAFSGPEK